jgi:N-acetylglutamate synthase-like GNAT family acetyltransferase
MQVPRYSHNDHYSTICEWLRLREAYVSPKDEVPEIGFVAVDEGTPVAVAFLRRVEGGFGQLDGLASNPDASSLQRHRGIDAVVTKVLETAQELGIKSVLSFTESDSTLMRSQSHGFVAMPHALIVVSTDRQRK